MSRQKRKHCNQSARLRAVRSSAGLARLSPSKTKLSERMAEHELAATTIPDDAIVVRSSNFESIFSVVVEYEFTG